MTNPFLTLEDVNGTIFSNQGFYWHEIDTSKISSENDFANVKYDFCEVTRITGSFQDFHYKFIVTVHSNNFTNGYYVTTVDDEPINFGPTYNTFEFWVTEPAVKIKLYMGNLKVDEHIVPALSFFKSSEVLNLNFKEINEPQTIHYRDTFFPDYDYTLTASVSKGYNLIKAGDLVVGYLLVNLLKSDFEFNCTQNLVLGKVNKVALGTLADYKPNGDMIGSYTPTITVQYGDETLPVQYEGTDYYFNLDLTDKTETGKIRFKVLVEPNEVLNSSETEVVLTSQYQTISTFDGLLSACGNNGTDIIQLGANITLTSSIPITHSIKIIGNNKTLNMESHNFVLNEDVTFKAENIVFDSGDTTIIQSKNTTVELTGCTFNNCTSSNYNGLGSCIFCDVDIDSLQISNDYETILTDCTFTDNANCILHGGELTVIGCTLENDDTNNINTNNTAFLYQTDGTCLIQQSTFTIDYDYTSAEANIGFAQALIMCGETANINGATYTNLGEDNSLPFFEAPFNNRADLDAKYYYPQITDNVESIGTTSGKACCHAVSGVDWVFKNNVTVRRVG